MVYEEIISGVAVETGLSERLVDKTYKAYWRAIKQYIASLPMKEDLTDEEFEKLKPNINIPSIGKLHVTLDRYHRMKRHHANHYKNYLEHRK